MRYLLFVFLTLTSIISNAQLPSIELINAGNSNHFRGISAPSKNVVWISGTKGTIGSSIDGGKNWQWMQVKGFEKTDFRDIEAFNKKTAVIMGIDSPAVILRTTDGGLHWKTVYRNDTQGMFLDALGFYPRNKKYGIVVGDPINGKFFLATTSNRGKTWTEIQTEARPIADSGEACFAASGTNILMRSKFKFQFISGGLKSKLYTLSKGKQIPILQGNQNSGANSVSQYIYKRVNHIIITGGDYSRDTITEKNCTYSEDNGKTWLSPTIKPKGYRSAVLHIRKNELITCGTSGVDFSIDGGKNWTYLSNLSFHCIAVSKRGKSVFLAGAKGQIAKLKF